MQGFFVSEVVADTTNCKDDMGMRVTCKRLSAEKGDLSLCEHDFKECPAGYFVANRVADTKKCASSAVSLPAV